MAPVSDVGDIVLSLRYGAYDWLVKPPNSEDLLRVLSTAVSKSDLVLERSDDPVFSGLLGKSNAVLQLKILICKFAPASMPVLLTGESGTGKGSAAQALHDMSGRSGGPFYARNCGAFAPHLIESELFGTLAGSYTGAVDRPGCIEMSTGGSLFSGRDRRTFPCRARSNCCGSLKRVSTTASEVPPLLGPTRALLQPPTVT